MAGVARRSDPQAVVTKQSKVEPGHHSRVRSIKSYYQFLVVAGGASVVVAAVAAGAADALAVSSFLHSALNVLRSLPCRPFASACFEHSIDSGDFTLVDLVFWSVAANVEVAAKDKVIAATANASEESNP